MDESLAALMGAPEPNPKRKTSSTAILAYRVRQAGLAIQAGDEHAARRELTALADEAKLLARTDPLIATNRDRRLTVSASRAPSGRT